MRRGNGDGSIFKLAGKRRKPYAVRITVGWTNDGKQICRYIGYYKSKTEAKTALREYLSNPTEVVVKRVTLKYVFRSMMDNSKFSDGTIKQYEYGFNKLLVLHNKEFNKITIAEIEVVFKKERPSGQSVIKRVLANCYRYALKHQYVTRDLSQHLEPDTVTKEDKRERVPFTNEEITKLWSELGSRQFDDIPLILIYTGLRISELLELETSDINLTDKYIDVRKSKTEAGKRKIPIHARRLPLIASRASQGHKYLITTAGKTRGRKMGYVNYLDNYWYYRPHTIHETRHTFITALNVAGVDEITVKRIVGHANKDITEHYTHRTVNELLVAVNKIEY